MEHFSTIKTVLIFPDLYNCNSHKKYIFISVENKSPSSAQVLCIRPNDMENK